MQAPMAEKNQLRLKPPEDTEESRLSAKVADSMPRAAGSRVKFIIFGEEIIEKQIPDNPVNYKYTGDLLSFKVKRAAMNKVLDLFSPEAVERKKCYYPYWFIFYDDGDVDVIDALTGEKEKNLVLEDILGMLSL